MSQSCYISSSNPVAPAVHTPECQCEKCSAERFFNYGAYAAQLQQAYSHGKKKRRRGAEDIVSLCEKLTFVAQYIPAANRSVLSKNLAISALDTIRELREHSQILLPIKKLTEFEERLNAVVAALSEFVASNVKT